MPCPVGQKGIVVFAAAQAASRKAAAEFQALDGGNTEQRLCQTVFYSVKYRFAVPCRDTRNSAFHHTADRVAVHARFFNGAAHFFALLIRKHGERLCRHVVGLHLHGIIRCVTDIRDGIDMRAHPDAARFKHLQADAARKAKRRSQAAGEVSAARDILKAVELYIRGKIRVRGARRLAQVVVVPGAGIGIFDQHAERRTAGHAVAKAR